MRLNKVYMSLGIFCLLLMSTPNIQELTLLGRLDALSISLLSLAIILSPLSLPRSKIISFISAIILCLFITYNLLANLYSKFFLAYPLLDYWPVIKNGLGQIPVMIFILSILAITFVLIITTKVIHKSSININRLNNTLISSILFASFILSQLAYKNLYTYSETYTLKDTSASAFLLRSSINTGIFYQDLESKSKHRLNALINSIPDDGHLPSIFHTESLSKFTGHAKLSNYEFPYPDKYPLYKTPLNITENTSNENIILIILEGVRSSELGLYGSKISATPNLDYQSQHFSVFKNNYSTAPLTAKSEFAINCSSLDHFSGSPISSRELAIKKKCIPKILSENGYSTHWIHGNEKEFYKRTAFLKQLGFTDIVDKKILIEEGYTSELGWGVSDEELFDYTFKKLSNIKHKFYAEILTLSNHSPFNYQWGIDIPNNIAYSNDQYFNSYRQGIYYTDYALNIFLEKFFASDLSKNTHIIITGDHGAWTFDNESLSQLTKDEKFFRVPLMIYSPNSKPINTIGMTSHIDVAPTILDLLDLQTPNSFMGMTAYSEEELLDNRSIYSFYDRIYSIRSNEDTCVPMQGCFASNSCPKLKSTLKADKNPANMICGDTKITRNMLVSAPATHSTSSSTLNRSLLDYSQLSLIHPSAPAKNLILKPQANFNSARN